MVGGRELRGGQGQSALAESSHVPEFDAIKSSDIGHRRLSSSTTGDTSSHSLPLTRPPHRPNHLSPPAFSLSFCCILFSCFQPNSGEHMVTQVECKTIKEADESILARLTYL